MGPDVPRFLLKRALLAIAVPGPEHLMISAERCLGQPSKLTPGRLSLGSRTSGRRSLADHRIFVVLSEHRCHWLSWDSSLAGHYRGSPP